MGGSFSKVGVVGLGTMGAGIAEVLARGGLAVVGIEINEDALARGRGHLEKSTGRAVKRGKLTGEGQREILERIALSTAFRDLEDCDLVIEAVPERLELKRRVFEELDKVCRDDAVLATNTSSLSVTEIAVSTNRPQQIVGVHFFNPAPVMKLVEVIGTVLTGAGAVERVAELVRGLGKTPVTVGDRAGFVANRLLFGYLNQAASMYDSGHATLEDIDTAMKVGGGLPMGPFNLMDLIGLDTCLEVLEAIYRESRDRRHAPAPVLRELVTAGLLGRKTGRGFYSYDNGKQEPVARGREIAQPVVGVVGSGQLAVGIAAASARAGAEVRLVAGDEDRAEAAWSELGAVHGEEDKARVTGGTELSSLADCDLVIDAGDEGSSLAAVGDAARQGAVLATTDSTVPVIKLAMATDRPADVVGLHFAEVGGKLVEVVSTVASAPETVERAMALAGALGLHAVRCRDRAGFIVDALRFPYLNDAAAMLEAGYADADAIDAAMTLGCGYPIGPIADLDRLGLDRAVAVLRALYAESREAALAPAPLLEEYATAGRSLR